MGVPFPDIDPYKELGVANDAVPPAIKKAYYKLCLKYHPDKLQKESSKARKKHTIKFQRVQFSYSILRDAKKRARYDSTGSVEDSVILDDDFDWKDFFKRYTEKKVTKEMIDQDKKQYQGSVEEKDDILSSMQYYKGEFIRLFEAIPHLEFSKEQEQRVFKIVSDLIDSEEMKEYPAWIKYVKNRKKEIRKMAQRSKKEAKEAEKLLEEIKAKNGKKKDKADTEDSLAALIRANHRKKKDPFEQLVAKYSKNNKGRSSRAKKSEYDIDDDEFERVQKEMLSRKKR